MQQSYKLFVTDTVSAGGSLFHTDGVAASGTQYSKKMKPSPTGDLGFTLESTGTVTGTFTLWYSDEDSPSEANDTDWVQDTTWVPTNPAGAATKTKYVVSGLRARWARVKHVTSGGAGNLLGYGNY